jgi:hypothetical protein
MVHNVLAITLALSGADIDKFRIIRFRYTGGAARYGQHEMGEI